MENNIFKDAKFGDKFFTRDGRIAIYWQQICYPEEYMCLSFILENECIETDLYDGVTLSNGIKTSCNTDIVSRYQEPIDEEKLNKLAEDSKNNIKMFCSAPHVFEMATTYENGFKNGYRKAKEKLI